MRRYARIFGLGVKTQLAALVAYRADFLVGMALSMAGELLLPLLTALIYGSGATFPGWSYHEALLLQGLFILSRGVSYALFFGMTGNVMYSVREGTFDLVMIRPVSAAFLSAVQTFSLQDVGVVLSGAALCAYASTRVQLHLTAGAVLWFAVLFLAAMAVLLGFTLMMSATAFKWVGNSRIFEIFEAIAGFGRYPATIYPGVFRVLVTNVFPVAVLGSLPAELILGKRPTQPMELAVVVLCCMGFLLAGYAAWRAMIRSYVSTGG